jgi:hypothetical protein
MQLSSFSCLSLLRTTVTAGQLFFMLYFLASEQLLLSQPAAHYYMMYLLSSEQLLLSESAAHHGDSWAAVFLCCTYVHLSSFFCPSLPGTMVTAGQLFFMLYLLASQQLSCPGLPCTTVLTGQLFFYYVLTCISAASPVPVCRTPQ